MDSNDDNTNEVAEEVDDTPAWVKEGTEEDDFTAEGEDISKAEQMVGGSDVLEPVNGVEMKITQVKVDKYVPEGKEDWKTARMEVWLVIGPKGIDGKGKYANKHFFPRLGFAVNRGAYDFSTNAQGKPTTFYDPTGGFFGDYNAFLQALGFKTNPAPKNDAAFRKELIGRTLTVNVKKDRKQVKNSSTGKYERVNEYENVLEYVASKPKATTQVQAEAAAS